jgi:hypothetical protein
MTANLQSISDRFAAAVEVAERRWVMLRNDKFQPRQLMRYVRSLRRCDRIRAELKAAVEEGAL